MRTLITGSSGLVGAEMAAALRALGHEVVDFDIARMPADGLAEDIRNLDVLSDRMRGCDGIVHLAAVSRVAWGERDPELCHSVNVDGTRRVVDAALSQPRIPWLIFASSREVYGDPDVLPVTEDAPMIAANHYGRSKVEGERLVAAARDRGCAARSSGCPMSTERPTTTPTARCPRFWRRRSAARSCGSPARIPSSISFMSRIASGQC